MLIFVLSVLGALGISAMCSLLEAALLSFTPSQVARLSESQPRLGKIWRGFKENIERPIAFILILNTAAHTIGASVAGAQFDALFGNEWVWLFSLVFTVLMLQFTEILPKNLGVRFNHVVAKYMAKPLAGAVRITAPLIRLVYFMNRPFEGKTPQSQSGSTLEEIAALAAMARHSRQIGSLQEQVIKGASDLSQTTIQEVMIPVNQVSFLSASQDLESAVKMAEVDFHTRYPVRVNEDSNQVIGYVNFKELVNFMRSKPHLANLQAIIRPVHMVSPESNVAAQLKAFVGQRIHMAMVRDSSGRILGLVTLEDLLEELVGEVEDEFDRLPRYIHPLGGEAGSAGGEAWMIGGGAPMAEVARQLHAGSLAYNGLVADWVESKSNGQPKPGHSWSEGGLEFVVRRVRRNRTYELEVRRLKAETE